MEAFANVLHHLSQKILRFLKKVWIFEIFSDFWKIFNFLVDFQLFGRFSDFRTKILTKKFQKIFKKKCYQIRLQRWYITIPSSDQWCTTIENHRYQWLSYPKTIGKPLIPMVALNHSIQWWWKLWKPLKICDGSKRVCWKSNKHNNQL